MIDAPTEGTSDGGEDRDGSDGDGDGREAQVVEPVGEARRHQSPERQAGPEQRQAGGRQAERHAVEESNQPVGDADLGRDVAGDGEFEGQERPAQGHRTGRRGAVARNGGVAPMGQRGDREQAGDRERRHGRRHDDGLPRHPGVHELADHQGRRERSEAEEQVRGVERPTPGARVEVEDQPVSPAVEGPGPEACRNGSGEDHAPERE